MLSSSYHVLYPADLQVQGQLLGYDHGGGGDDSFHDVYDPLVEVLEKWKRDSSHPLAARSLLALDAEGVWALVNSWNLHFQQELLHM